MPEAEAGATGSSGEQQLTPAQERAIERIKKQKGGVAAGYQIYAERHKTAAERRAERGY